MIKLPLIEVVGVADVETDEKEEGRSIKRELTFNWHDGKFIFKLFKFTNSELLTKLTRSGRNQLLCIYSCSCRLDALRRECGFKDEAIFGRE